MKSHHLIFTGRMPCGDFPTITEARKALTAEAKGELAAARRKWGTAHLDRVSPDCVEIRANRHRESALWTRIAVIAV